MAGGGDDVHPAADCFRNRVLRRLPSPAWQPPLFRSLTPVARSAFFLLVAAGAAICGYLLFRHVELVGESQSAGVDVCTALFGGGCDAALESSFSTQLGLPLAGWGLVFYGTLTALILLGLATGGSFQRDAAGAALALTGAGAVVSIALASLLAFRVVPFCPLCVVVQCINLLLLVAASIWLRRQATLPISAPHPGPPPDAADTQATAHEARWKPVGYLCAALVGVVLYQWIFIEVREHVPPADRPPDARRILAEYESTPRNEIPVSADDAATGSVDWPVRLIVFSDFRCSACRRFAARLTAVRRRYGDRLRIVFKHFPLSPACNRLVQRDLHPGACDAAYGAEAARRQERFWQLHDLLFTAAPGRTPDDITSAADGAGLDMAQFSADLAAASTRDRIGDDVELALRLGIEATPAVFVNGRPVRDTRVESLAIVIDHELRRAHGAPMAAK